MKDSNIFSGVAGESNINNLFIKFLRQEKIKKWKTQTFSPASPEKVI